MLIGRMDPKESDAFLSRVGFGRLACARNNEPYIVPIYFGHQPGRLYGFAAFGQKIEWMRENPRVCVQVDEISAPDDWTSVVVRGRYEELPDSIEHIEKRKWALSLLEAKAPSWGVAFAASRVRTSPNTHPAVFYCIHIEALSGVRGSPGDKIVETFRLKV